MCGGGAWLHIQGKGKHCLIGLNEYSVSQVKLNESGSKFAAFGLKMLKNVCSCFYVYKLLLRDNIKKKKMQSPNRDSNSCCVLVSGRR